MSTTGCISPITYGYKYGYNTVINTDISGPHSTMYAIHVDPNTRPGPVRECIWSKYVINFAKYAFLDPCTSLCHTTMNICSSLCDTTLNICSSLCDTTMNICSSLCHTTMNICSTLCHTTMNICSSLCDTTMYMGPKMHILQN